MTGELPGNDQSRWYGALGAVAVVFGLLLAVSHANEWMKQAVIAASTPASQQLPAADCPEDELEEEGLSRAECEHMVARVQAYVLSVPQWFPPVQTALSALGALVALASLAIGAALVNLRPWAPRLATVVFATLLAIDGAGFVAAVNAGPMIRSEYLWPTLLWFVLHLTMLVACAAAFHDEPART